VKNLSKPATRPDIEGKLVRYLSGWPQGLSTDRMGAWIHSCTKGGGYTEKEFTEARRSLREKGIIAFASGVWYLRKTVT